MASANNTKDFNLLTLDLTNATGKTLNLRFVMVEINVYEDLWSNNTTCSILMNDANNLLMNFPIFGFESLLLEFETPEKERYSKTFRLVRITDRALIRERELGYILHFATPEAVTNLKTRVSKSYKGKLFSEIVSDLHTNLLSGGGIEIEDTKNQQHVLIPNLYPAHAINWICTRSNSAAYEGASYLYYESKDQYHFVSMESRLEQATTQTYLYQPANVRSDGIGHKSPDLETNFVAVETYTFDHHSDILANMQTGMYGNELLTHSQVRKQWQRHTFDYQSSFGNYKHLYESNMLYSQEKADLASQNNRLKLHSTGQDEYEYFPEQWIPVRISQLQQLHNTKLTITVPGDSERTVGEVVEFTLPSPEPPIENKQIDDKYFKGRYLIASLRHKIDRDKYTTTMELVQDSVFEAYP